MNIDELRGVIGVGGEQRPRATKPEAIELAEDALAVGGGRGSDRRSGRLADAVQRDEPRMRRLQDGFRAPERAEQQPEPL